MHRIAIANGKSLKTWLRQTPSGLGIWEGTQFTLDDQEAPSLFVIDDIPPFFSTRTPIARRVFVVTEPTGIRTYSRSFLSQFGLVLSPFAMDAGNVPVHISQTGLPWMYGLEFSDEGTNAVLSFEDLVTLKPGPKLPVISVVCSTKSKLPRHRERLLFLEALKERLGDRLNIYGRGFCAIKDKAEAISGARYHLVLENNDLGCFWTEKLADAFLGWSLPIFAGPRDALQDFPEGSMAYIDLERPDLALDQVCTVLDEDPFQDRLPLIAAARERLLFEHNFFALAVRIEKNLPEAKLLEAPQTLRPAFQPSKLKLLRSKLRSALGIKHTG